MADSIFEVENWKKNDKIWKNDWKNANISKETEIRYINLWHWGSINYAKQSVYERNINQASNVELGAYLFRSEDANCM